MFEKRPHGNLEGLYYQVHQIVLSMRSYFASGTLDVLVNELNIPGLTVGFLVCISRHAATGCDFFRTVRKTLLWKTGHVAPGIHAVESNIFRSCAWFIHTACEGVVCLQKRPRFPGVAP